MYFGFDNIVVGEMDIKPMMMMMMILSTESEITGDTSY